MCSIELFLLTKPTGHCLAPVTVGQCLNHVSVCLSILVLTPVGSDVGKLNVLNFSEQTSTHAWNPDHYHPNKSDPVVYNPMFLISPRDLNF